VDADLALVRASPQAVLARDRRAWLGLFGSAAVIEDPVGASRYATPIARAAFWDTFIAPQERIEFRVLREFQAGGTIVRQVVIETQTAISSERLRVPAIVEYQVEGTKIAALRAFWRPTVPLQWFARQGVKGLWALSKHNVRLTRNLGPKALLDFASALRPAVSAERAAGWMQQLGAGPTAWAELLRGAVVEVDGDTGDDPARRALGGDDVDWTSEQVLLCGREVAAVLTTSSRAAVVLVKADARGAIERLRWVPAVT